MSNELTYGNPNPVGPIQEIGFDPQYGYNLRYLWRGSRAALHPLAQSANALGARTTARQIDGTPRWELTAVFGDMATADGGAGSAEVPVDQYDIDTEFFQESIFGDPKADKEAVKFAINLFKPRSKYRGVIEDAVKDKLDFPLSETEFPAGAKIYRALTRKNDARESRRINLRRVRTFSLNYPSPVVLNANEVFYSTTELGTIFGIPGAVLVRLPGGSGGNPMPTDPPQDTVWSWKLRADKSSLLPKIAKWQETKEWTLAAWLVL